MDTADSAAAQHNRLRPEDRAAHDWYRFVLSFPPHLVRNHIERFGLRPGQRVLDPFCGTGTTLVECKKLGIESIGIEANPIAWFASRVKTTWRIDPDELLDHANELARLTMAQLTADGVEDALLPLFQRNGHRRVNRLRSLPLESFALLLKNSISPLPLHKALTLMQTIEEGNNARLIDHEKLALAQAVVFHASNLNFGPEVGVGPAKSDAAVVEPWMAAIRAMSDDLRELRKKPDTESVVFQSDSRGLSEILPPNSIDMVITSPPYPNEKDYTRATRLETVLLGLIRNKNDLRAIKRQLIRSNTRGVYKADIDDALVAGHEEIQSLAGAIEQRRIELGKTSGFERLYARVTKLYFGGMARHLADLRTILRPGARLAYVVGDQASYLRVMIRTGRILADIAQSLGYELEDIELFRTRRATETREELREEVVLLRWPGIKSGVTVSSERPL